MNGVYRLMTDINLPSDWACIGSEQKPFTGYFDGNGHKITFTQSSAATTLGLFAYNNGIITSLEVVGCNVGIENESCTYGFIAVKNGGYITACRLSGSFKVTATVYLSSDEYATVNKDTYFIFGGIVGINAIDGVVNGCTVDATITIENKNVAECSAKWSIIDLVRKGGYKNTHVSSMLVINFGGIVGENLGLIEACDVSSTITCKEEIPEATVKNYYGYASAKTVFYGGSISGSPMGTVRDCTVSVAMKYTDFDKATSNAKSGKLFGYEYEYHRYRLDVTNTPRP